MKLLFVQLPVQEPGWDSGQANVPLAAGYLTATAERAGSLRREDWKLLDQDTIDFGSDTAVVEAIVHEDPDLCCFTLYSWNIERSVHIAGRASSIAPRIRFVAGGPEVVKGMPVSDRSPFTALVEGEGETSFLRILDDMARHVPLSKLYSAPNAFDALSVPNPYLAGTLKFRKDRPVHLETVRGCPFRCGYCSYGKNHPDVRPFDPAVALQVIEQAGAAGVHELYLMDPSFGIGGADTSRLIDIARANSAGMSLHAELRLEDVTEEAGRLLAAAGLVSAEAGLQSVNPLALQAVGRTWDRAAFERGAEILDRNRIIVKTGLILGLPFDTYEHVIETFDFLGMHGLGQESELYPLSLLPGTDVRARADDWGMTRMERPPYWVTSTDWISGDDMADAVAAFEESFDVEWASPPAPVFRDYTAGFRTFIDVRRGPDLEWMRLNPSRLANSVTLLVDSDDPENLSRLVRTAKGLRKDNPFTLYQIVFFSNTRIPSERLSNKVREAFSNPDHYYELSRYFSLDPQPGYQTRLFFATKNPSLAYRAMEEAQDLETVLVLTGKAGFNADRLAEQLPFVAFDKENMPFDRVYDLMSIYADFRHMLVEVQEELFST